MMNLLAMFPVLRREPAEGSLAARDGSNRGERGRSFGMPTLNQQRALLVILLATSERALEAFQAADNEVDAEFVGDLERIISRSRGELDNLNEKIAASS
jgi:hypothetical protein